MQQLIIILSLFLLIGCKKENYEPKILVIDRHEVFKGVSYPSGAFKLEWVFDYNDNKRVINQKDFNPNYIEVDKQHRYKQVKI